MDAGGFFSADSHVNEPEATWAGIPEDLRARGPHFVQDPPGKKGLYFGFDGHKLDPVGQTFTAGTARDPEVVRDRVENFTWDRWRGPWDPDARLGDMQRDGVEAEILYPSMARNFYALSGEDTALQLAGIQSYNDWITGYCAALPERLFAIGLLSVLDIEFSVIEMERIKALGHKGALLPAELPDGMSYADPAFEPIWATAERLDMPLHFHINVNQGSEREAYRIPMSAMIDMGRRAVKRAIAQPDTLLTDLLFGLVLETHPGLRVVFAEYELAWILPFLYRFEGNARRFPREYPGLAHMTRLPGETIRQQVFVTFQNDPAGLAGAERLGLLDNCMWANDYPHGGATWPNSQEIVARQLEGFDAATARKLVWENTARLYRIA
ncbi:MAG: amidohydrolase family protein [Alphaproteobacteria bacterium]|nr:amidohydrolase family protein [Alphaproteobacteria bacterium]